MAKRDDIDKTIDDIDKTRITICYLLDRKFVKCDVMEKKGFAYELFKGDRVKVDEIFERSLKYDHPILEAVSYALEEIYLQEDPFDIVNHALTESGLKGLILNKEDLNIFSGNDEEQEGDPDLDDERTRQEVFNRISRGTGLETRLLVHFLLSHHLLQPFLMEAISNNERIFKILNCWYSSNASYLTTWSKLKAILELLKKRRLIREIEEKEDYLCERFRTEKDNWETLQNTMFTLSEPLMETPQKWSIIHSILACVKGGSKKTPRDVMKEVKQEISEHKDFYSTMLPCIDQFLNEFKKVVDMNGHVIAVALSNVFKINIMILNINNQQLYYLPQESSFISPSRVKQSRGRIELTVNDDGHFFPLLNLKEIQKPSHKVASKKSIHMFRTHEKCCILEIQNWSTSDKITNITLTDVQSGVVKRLDLDTDVKRDVRAGNLYFLLKDLDDDLKYECKIDILNEDGHVDELRLKEFSIKDQVSHIIQSPHMTISSHDQHGSLLKWIKQGKDFKSDISYSFEHNDKTVPVNDWLENCEKYVETNLTKNNYDYLQEWMIFPPIYMDVNRNKTKEIAQMLKEVLPTTCNSTSNKGGLILVDYDSRKHSDIVCNLDSLTNRRKFDNRITIFHKELNAIVNIRVTESDHLKAIPTEMHNCVEDSKDMITIMDFLMTNTHTKDSKIQIHNMVCATNIDSDSLNDGIDQVKYLCPRCIPNVLTKEHLISKEKFGSWIKEELRPVLLNEPECNLQKYQKGFRNFIGQATCFMANTSIQIVSCSGYMHQHNATIQLNDDQVNVVVNPMKHKLIKGGFGVGKTIIGILHLQFLARIAMESTKLFYISFDPFSILDSYVSKHIESLQLQCLKDDFVNIEVSNISEMAKNMGVYKLPSVSNILEYVQNVQKETKRTCHIIMDEVNGDLMNQLEVEQVNKQLGSMKKSYITIILQPCEKYRTRTEANRTTLLSSFHYKDLTMVPFTLSKCMRNSVRIHKLVESAQATITAEPSLHVQQERRGDLGANLFQRTYEEGEYNQGNAEIKTSKIQDVGTYNASNEVRQLTEYQEYIENLTDVNTTLLVKPDKDLDTRHNLLDEGKLTKSSTYTTTTIEFTQAKEIGHKEEGTWPRICYLPSTKGIKSEFIDQKLERNQLLILQLMICLMDVIVDCGDVIICNNSFEITVFKYALSIISTTSILVFAPYIQNQEMPDERKKKEVLACLEKRNKIILTDKHSFCGMQCTRLIMPIQFQEIHERQVLVENISRATTTIIFIVMNKNSTKKSTFGRVVKQWEKEKLVQSSKAKIDKEKLPDLVKQLPTSNDIAQELSIDRAQTDLLNRIQHIGYDYIEQLINNDDIDTLSQMLLIDATFINTISKDYGMTPLIYAVSHHKLPMVKLFVTNGVDVALCSRDGSNAIHVCARLGFDEALSSLINICDDKVLNERDNSYNQTPLWYASSYGSIECVRLLLKRNVDVNDDIDRITVADVAGVRFNGHNRDEIIRLITDYKKKRVEDNQ